MKLMITGPQGCGKTTQAKILASKLGIEFIGAGDLLRDFAEKQTIEGQEVKEELEKGELVDDELLADLVKKEISQKEFEKGFVADGYPRTASQLEIFDPKYDQVFYLKLSEEEAIKRLMARGREDDHPDQIKERLSWYHKKTQPVLDYYQKAGNLIIINGEQGVEEVTKEIEKNLKL